jgi:phospholipase C
VQILPLAAGCVRGRFGNTCCPRLIKRSSYGPARSGLSRREALERFGVLLGSTVLPGAAGCGLGPRVCAGEPPAEIPPATEQDARARALLEQIDTFVVVMLENRSFDHFLGGLRLDSSYPGRAELDGLTGQEANLDSGGRLVRVARMPGDGRGSVIPAHDWARVRQTFNGGKNDRFVAVNRGPFETEVMSYLGRDQLPFFHALADRFTVFDRWFASYMGQTWPNRYYLHATTSAGRRTNRPLGINAPLSIWERMAERCHSTRNYGAGKVLWYSVAFPTRLFSGESAVLPGQIEDFFHDARTGNLPNFSIIDPDFTVNDAYPKRSPALCEAFVAGIVRALAESPQWKRSLLLITFDEHGGYYDHVAPPLAPDVRPDFRQLGFRVPALAVGPTVWQGKVVSTQLEHVSVAATLRARFGIQTLSPRMDAANDVSGCIDPRRLADPAPAPRDLPRVELESVSRIVAESASSQAEIDEALRERRVPAELVDPRSDAERISSWLRLAQELDVVRVAG